MRKMTRRVAGVARWGWLCIAASGLFPIGAAQGQVAVSESGQPVYSVPIAVPPGIAGMEPKLTLQYSRGPQGGPFGVGWSLGGLSVITRCGSTAATDGLRKGVRYTAEDRFCLDGQRLILTDADGNPLNQAAYANANAEYRTEKDSFARVRAFGGSAATGPDSFKVWTKSGLIYEYGASTNARIGTTGRMPAVTMAWAVNKVSDTTGNFMSMSYNVQTTSFAGSAGTEWNIAQIRYTGNGAQAPANRVDFAYVDRFDVSEALHEGAKSVNSKRMVSVRSFTGTNADGTGGRAVGLLNLGYGTSPHTDRALLAWVQNCAGPDAARCLPKIEFTYTPGPGVAFAPMPTNLTGIALRTALATRGVYQGDFNGDGRQDLLVWDDDHTQNRLLLSNGDGSFTSSPAAGAQLGHSNGCQYSVVADFNLDGVSDVLQVSDPDALPACALATRSAQIFLGSSTGVFQAGVNVTNAQGQPFPLLRTDPTYSGGQAQCGGTSEADWACNGYTPVGIYRSGSIFYVADVDGDGAPDILVTNTAPGSLDNPATACAPGERTCLYLGSPHTVGVYTKVSTSLAQSDLFSPRNEAMGRSGVPGTYAENRIFIGDLNTDALPDILVRDTGVRYMATGTPGVFEQKAGDASPCLSGVEVLDINGDGKWDLACMDYGKEGNYTAFVNDGAGKFTLRGNVGTWAGATGCVEGEGGNAQSAPCPSKLYRGFITYLAADLDGDGISDVLALGKSRYAGNGTRNAFLKGQRNGSFLPFALPLDIEELAVGAQDVLVGDFTGRGTVELLRFSHQPEQTALFARADSVPADMLKTATTAGNAQTTLHYKPLTDSTVYTRGSGAVYPQVDFAGAQWVVSSVDAPNGRGGVVTTSYRYERQRADLSGRGHLGFWQVERTAPAANGALVTTRTRSRQDFPYIGLPEETRRYLHQDGATDRGASDWLSHTSSTYGDLHTEGCPSNGSPRLYRPVLKTSIEQSRDLNGAGMAKVNTTNSGYTCFGDPGVVTVVTTHLPETADVYTRVTTNQYLPAATWSDNWILGRLSSSRQSNTVPNKLSAPGVPQSTPTPPSSLPGTPGAVVVDFCTSQTPAGRWLLGIPPTQGNSIHGNNQTGYALNSDLATAATHAGLLGVGEGGFILTIPIGTSTAVSAGTQANGITSTSAPANQCVMLISKVAYHPPGVSAACWVQTPASQVVTGLAQTASAHHRVWGGPNSNYTVDSHLALAAVHSGLVAVGQTASLTVTPRGEQLTFGASTQFGVTSHATGGPSCAMDLWAPPPPHPETPVPAELDAACQTSLYSGLRQVTGRLVTDPSNPRVTYGDQSRGYNLSADLGVAALHAGLVGLGETADISVIGLSKVSGFGGSSISLRGTVRNGVATLDYVGETCAIRLARAPGYTPPAPHVPALPPTVAVPTTIANPACQQLQLLSKIVTGKRQPYWQSVSQTPVWGSNTGGYRSDSDLSIAAVHAGLLQEGETGLIHFLNLDEGSVAGVIANGVRSQSYGGACRIRLVRDPNYVARPPPPASPAPQTAEDVACNAAVPYSRRVVGAVPSGLPWVYGNNATGYTTDSDVSLAATHAGLVGPGEFAEVQLIPQGKLPGFTSTTANGITSQGLNGAWCGMKLYKLYK